MRLSSERGQIAHRFIKICAHGIPKFTLYLARPGPFYRSRSPDSRLRAYLATRHGDLRQTLAQCPSRGHCLLFLHHRLRELTGKDAVLPDATDYYTRMTEEQRMALIRTDLDEQEELDHALLQAAPTARDLTQKNALIRESFDIWHALHPTALGNCGCPGLCPRGNDLVVGAAMGHGG